MDADATPIPGRPHVRLRGDLTNSRIRFERERKGRVAFMGGSITEMEGYRPMVCRMLEARFPGTEFDFVNAGISSTCSTTGAFRLERDVLSRLRGDAAVASGLRSRSGRFGGVGSAAQARGRVDLFFVEFAVNDLQDAGHGETECVRGMEGIVRRARRANPAMDIVNVHFVNPEMIGDYDAGRTPAVVAAHERVARHYAVPSIEFAREVAEGIRAGEFDWKTFGGTHPSAFGNGLCARAVKDLLEAAWKEPLPDDAEPRPHPAPPAPLDPMSYERGRLVDPGEARIEGGFRVGVPDWGRIGGSVRGRHRGVELLSAEEPGASFGLRFEGTAVGLYVLAGPDAGTVEFAVDGGEPAEVDLFHRFSRGLHYPRTCMLEAELEGGASGRHELVVRVSGRKNPGSRGHAVRILGIAVN